MNEPLETWGAADAYERWVGRWSRKVAADFLRWLSPPRRLDWADIGCGTGQLTACALAEHEPASIVGLDASHAFIREARRVVDEGRARFVTGDATRLPWSTDAFDVAMSGLVLNFVPDHLAMTREMVRVAKPGGRVAIYVWDYAGGMQMMRYFWDAAIAVNPHDASIDQAERFPICHPDRLRQLFERAGLRSVEVRAIDVRTVFESFDDYWEPFLGRQGAAPTYLATLDEETQERIRDVLRSRLAVDASPIELTARAWAVQGCA